MAICVKVGQRESKRIIACVRLFDGLGNKDKEGDKVMTSAATWHQSGGLGPFCACVSMATFAIIERSPTSFLHSSSLSFFRYQCSRTTKGLAQAIQTLTLTPKKPQKHQHIKNVFSQTFAPFLLLFF